MAYSDELPDPRSVLEWDPEVQKKLCAALAGGNTLRVAAALADIRYDTVLSWIKKGNDQEEGSYHEFVAAVNHAIAVAQGTAVKTVRDAAKRDWRAAAWFLERTQPDEWGAKKEGGGGDATPITVKLEFPAPPPLPANQPTLPTGQQIVDVEAVEKDGD